MAFPLTIAFDRTNPAAVAWAQRRSAQLVVDVSTQTRAAVRRIVGRAFTDKLTVDETARLLRDTVGLTEDQADWVYNLRRDILASPGKTLTRGKLSFKVPAQGANGDFVRWATARYSAAIIRMRAETIARSEIMVASNEGQRQLWLQARAAGLIEDTDQRRWISTRPIRSGAKRATCDVCKAMHGRVTGIDEPFVLPDGTPVMNAHAHPRCRCTEGLVVESVARAASLRALGLRVAVRRTA